MNPESRKGNNWPEGITAYNIAQFEQLKELNPQTRKGLEPTYGNMENFFAGLPQPIREIEGIKKLEDGAQIVVTKYKQEEHVGFNEVDTFAVSVSDSQKTWVASFVLTSNGLFTVSTDKQKTVSLRSLLYPKAGENLRVDYLNGSSGTLKEFRNAAKPLMSWVLEMDKQGQLLPCPISIVEKVKI